MFVKIRFLYYGYRKTATETKNYIKSYVCTCILRKFVGVDSCFYRRRVQILVLLDIYKLYTPPPGRCHCNEALC